MQKKEMRTILKPSLVVERASKKPCERLKKRGLKNQEKHLKL